MIEYQLRVYPSTWYELSEKDFVPNEGDFEKLIWKVGNETFEEWSTEFEHAWLVEKLRRD